MQRLMLTLQLGAEETPTSMLQRRLRSCRVVAVSCAFSVAIYGLFVSGMMSLRSAAPVANPGEPSLRFALYLLALVAQLMCYATVKLLPRPKLPVDTLAGRLQSRTVLRMAFSEIPAVFGVILFLAGRSTLDFALLGTLSLVLIALRWPSTEEWEAGAAEAGLKVHLG